MSQITFYIFYPYFYSFYIQFKLTTSTINTCIFDNIMKAKKKKGRKNRENVKSVIVL